ncbi:MAG: DnaJ C-terminal domain-containing protein [Hyphomicrobiaceae bacterium]
MAQNPYVLLGVSETATDEEIRRAYRRLAKELHPDLNPDDANAADRFKNVSAAYKIVGDKETRQKFDAGLIDASGDPVRGFAGAGAGGFGSAGRRGPAGAGFDDADFSGIFGDIFGGGFGGAQRRPAQRRGQDVRYTLEVDFIESIEGAKKRVTLPEGGVLDLNVPAGVTDGKTLRLKGKGGSGFNGGASGDALVEIKVRPDTRFTREKNDILITLAISIDEAIIGGKIEVPTVSGRVNLTIPKGTSSGRTFRLKGKGVTPAGAKPGDQLVTVEIVLPDEIDEDLEDFLTKWREHNSYNPRQS